MEWNQWVKRDGREKAERPRPKAVLSSEPTVKKFVVVRV